VAVSQSFGMSEVSLFLGSSIFVSLLLDVLLEVSLFATEDS
jgi:hypothetical protein